MTNVEEMKTLITQLNAANEAYYAKSVEIMSNFEYDQLYDKLLELETMTGIRLSGSPTQKVGYMPTSKLPKETHEVAALSLDKTKDILALKEFLANEEAVLSWKLDGLTIVLTYNNGILEKAVTRGNGQIGEIVTNNAKAFVNVPLTIPVKEKIIVRGEALIRYDDFQKINEALPAGEEPYKNPRNLCAGSVRQLDPNEVKKRKVHFVAFAMGTEDRPYVYRKSQLDALATFGFDVVEHVLVDGDSLEEQVEAFSLKITDNPFPTDGLVLQLNDIAFGKSLGMTSKFPRDAMAFKWTDEEKSTIVQRIEWSTARTGQITPVAVFDPIELEGTTVTRASVHNVSILKQLSITPGDTVMVYKANMIIPQISKNLTSLRPAEIPTQCPVCGEPVKHRIVDASEMIYCVNPNCMAKHVKYFVHAVSRDALNMEGISEETLRKLIMVGILTSLPDLFRLSEHRKEIIGMDGFGEKSFINMIESIEQARHTTLPRLLYALGIEYVGRTASKGICRHFQYDTNAVVTATKEQLLEIPDIGDAIATSFVTWFQNQIHQELFETLLDEIVLEKPVITQATMSLAGKTYVITGSLTHFRNREELKAKIEELGGKVSGSVSSKTTALINNNVASTSGKNKKAKELGVPIISEESFLANI